MFFDLPAKEIETNVSLPKFKDESKNSKRKKKSKRKRKSSGRRDATRGKGEACTRLARLPVPDHCPCQAKDCPCAAKRTRPNLKFECNFHAHSTFFVALRKEFFGIRSFSPVEPRQSKCFSIFQRLSLIHI